MNWLLLNLLLFILERLLVALWRGESVPPERLDRLRLCLIRMEEVRRAAQSRGILAAEHEADGLAEALGEGSMPGCIAGVVFVIVVLGTILWLVLARWGHP